MLIREVTTDSFDPSCSSNLLVGVAEHRKAVVSAACTGPRDPSTLPHLSHGSSTHPTRLSSPALANRRRIDTTMGGSAAPRANQRLARRGAPATERHTEFIHETTVMTAPALRSPARCGLPLGAFLANGPWLSSPPAMADVLLPPPLPPEAAIVSARISQTQVVFAVRPGP